MAQVKPILTLAAGAALAMLLLSGAAQVAGVGLLVREEAAEPGTAEAPPDAQGPSPEGQAAEPADAEPDGPALVGAATRTAAGAEREAVMAVAIEDGEATAYVCDGAELEMWLHGTAEGGELELTGPGGTRLAGSYDSEEAAGGIATSDGDWEFGLSRLGEAEAGLYRAEESLAEGELVVGWIVEDDGGQTGVASLDGAPLPAPPLDVETREAVFQGVELEADRIGADS